MCNTVLQSDEHEHEVAGGCIYEKACLVALDVPLPYNFQQNKAGKYNKLLAGTAPTRACVSVI
jgi:hypothetical protein